MKRLLLAFLFLLMASPSWAALVRGTPATLEQDASGDPWTFTLTTTAGQNVLVLLCYASNASDVFTNATFNGDAMSDVAGASGFNAGAATSTAAFVLATPDIGTTLTVSVDMTVSSDGACVAIAYSGGDTATPVSGAVFEEEDSVASTNQNVTCAVGGEVLSVAGIPSVEVLTEQTGQTPLLTGDDSTGAYMFSYEAGSGTNNVGASRTGSGSWAHGALCVQAGAATRRPTAPIIFQ